MTMRFKVECLACVHAFGCDHPHAPLRDLICKILEHRNTRGDIKAAPFSLVEGPARRRYGRLCISRAGLRNRGKGEPRPRIDRLERLAVCGIDKLTVDEQLVLFH
jgi:hypothetical protein